MFARKENNMLIKKCFLLMLLAGMASLSWAQFNPSRESVDDSKVIATVDGHDVTLGEWKKVLESAPPQLMQQWRTEPKAAISDWYITQYMGKRGEEEKLDQMSPLKEQLEANRMAVLAGAMINMERNAYPVSNEMLQEYYDAHAADYTEAEIKAIYLRFKPNVASKGTSGDQVAQAAKDILDSTRTGRSEADALTLARDIVSQLRGGADFAELAAKYSEDQMSKEHGGEFGQKVSAASSGLPKEFKSAVLKLKQGEISDPIRLSSGFYIVRVEALKSKELREVRPEIIQAIRQDHLVQFLEDLRQRFTTHIEDQAVFMNPAEAVQ